MSAPVAVTHLVENLERGGLERVVIDLVGAQLELGYRCQVVCLFEQGALAQELVSRGVPVEACGKRTGADPRAVLRARGHLRRHRSSVLHTHNMAAHYHGIAAAIGLGVRRRINTRHGMGSIGAPGRRDWLFARTMRVTDAVVTVCEAARRDLLARGIAPGKLVVVPNGIRVEAFTPASDDARARLAARLGLRADSRLVGFVGRLNPAKDPATLIRAFARAAGDRPEAALVLTGDGPLRGALEEVARATGLANRIVFLGDRGDVRELLPAFELFALSSLTEGYSIALLEACASALPIVATAVGGNAEIVSEGVNGMLVPAGDEGRFAEALGTLLADPARSRRMGAAGREWVLEHGSLRRMAADYARLYEP